VTARLRAKAIDAACLLSVVAVCYAGLAVAVNVLDWPVPASGDVLLPLGWVAWKAGHGLDSVPVLVGAVRRWLRAREAHRTEALHEAYGITYRRIGSPPSHAAGRAA
jgi:hypothetical protein